MEGEESSALGHGHGRESLAKLAVVVEQRFRVVMILREDAFAFVVVGLEVEEELELVALRDQVVNLFVEALDLENRQRGEKSRLVMKQLAERGDQPPQGRRARRARSRRFATDATRRKLSPSGRRRVKVQRLTACPFSEGTGEGVRSRVFLLDEPDGICGSCRWIRVSFMSRSRTHEELVH